MTALRVANSAPRIFQLARRWRSDFVQRMRDFDRGKFEELMRHRYFYAPSFQLYRGVSGLYDYGPLGCALQNNLLQYWRRHFVVEEDMFEIDCSILTPEQVLQTSGHVERFTDLLCHDMVTKERYRVDHLVADELTRRIQSMEPANDECKRYQEALAKIEGMSKGQFVALIREFNICSPNGNPLSKPEAFNLMFQSSIGATGHQKAFLRPETAQGQFLNFKRLLEFNNGRMPMASAQIGRSFRNEISPRAGLLRVREFTMAEIEHFVHPKGKNHTKFSQVASTALRFLPALTQQSGSSDVAEMTIGDAVTKGIVHNETLGYFMARIQSFLTAIGIHPDGIRFRQHQSNEMAHYASDCWDAEILTSYGWIECVGCADRAAYDLERHAAATGEELVVRERLSEPVMIEKRRLVLDHGVIGKSFRNHAGAVMQALKALDDAGIAAVDQDLKIHGHASIKLWNQICQVTSDMVRIEVKTVKQSVKKYTPHVIEPSFGIGRILYALLEHAFWTRTDDDKRHVLSMPPIVAPYPCLLLPLSNHPDLMQTVQKMRIVLKEHGIAHRVDDSAGSIGRRYARNDEQGTPFAITVDFDTLNDSQVTLRERDSCHQVRLPISDVPAVLADLTRGRLSWLNVTEKYPVLLT